MKDTACIGLTCKNKHKCQYYKDFGKQPIVMLPKENCNLFLESQLGIDSLKDLFNGKL